MWEGLGVLLLAMVVRVCRLERLSRDRELGERAQGE
jgi:hypothetical protein